MSRVLKHLQGSEPSARLSHIRPGVKATERQSGRESELWS